MTAIVLRLSGTPDTVIFPTVMLAMKLVTAEWNDRKIAMMRAKIMMKVRNTKILSLKSKFHTQLFPFLILNGYFYYRYEFQLYHLSYMCME